MDGRYTTKDKTGAVCVLSIKSCSLCIYLFQGIEGEDLHKFNTCLTQKDYEVGFKNTVGFHFQSGNWLVFGG